VLKVQQELKEIRVLKGIQVHKVPKEILVQLVHKVPKEI
jgi:hypothetical protein